MHVLNHPVVYDLRHASFYVTSPIVIINFYLCFDNRSDSFTVCMETITAVLDGPLCFAAAIAHLTGSRHRYPLQLIVSLCQLYGDTLYMCIEWKEGFVHGEYGHPLTFWFYFVFLNLFWIFVPLILIIQAYVALSSSPSGDLHRTKKKK